MDVSLRYFASLRESLGTSGETISLPREVATVGELRAWLCSRGAPWSEALADGRPVRAAVNKAMAHAGTPLAPGAEIAFFPPVTGG